MRRPRPVRASQSRPRLGFESLETRDMLFADAGIDWWSAWDAPVVDDWSWTFDDAWTSDAGGDAAWNDAWWVGDFESDGAMDPAFDAGGFDWTAGTPDVGADGDADTTVGIDDAVTSDEPVPPAAEPSALDPVNDATEEVVAEIVTDPVPETPALPTTEPESVVADVVVDDTLDDAAIDALPPPVVELTTDDAVAPSTVDEPVAVLPEPEEVPVDVPTDLPQAVDTTNDDGAVLVSDAGLPDAVVSDDEVLDDLATPDDTGDESVAPPTAVVVTPVALDPSAPVPVVAPIGIPSTSAAPTTTSSRSGFAAWGAIFFQAFGRPADGADGATSVGEPAGQTGSGRSRVRLPSRPRG